MKKQIVAAIGAALLFSSLSAAAFADSLFVDNKATDPVAPERLNLRAEPEKSGGIIGLYYTGTEVENLGRENETYTKVSVGGLSGYMATEYLITADEAEKRYHGDFATGREVQIDLAGLWLHEAAIYRENDANSEKLLVLSNGDNVDLLGIVDNWAYVAVSEGNERLLGYILLDLLTDTEKYKVSIVTASKADARIILYDQPNTKGKEIMSIKNGAACFSAFGQSVGGWRRVRIGGISGWIKSAQGANLTQLGNAQRSSVPYYPLVMQTKGDAELSSAPDGRSGRFMTLGQGMRVEILAECGDLVYVRTMEGGAGATDCGDFGFIPLSMLTLTQSTESIGKVRIDDGDVPVLLMEQPDDDAKLLGALCPGAEVAIAEYTQTEYLKISLGGVQGYVLKQAIAMGDVPVQKIPQRATLITTTALWDKPNGRASGNVLEVGSRAYVLGSVNGWVFVREDGDDDKAQEGFLPLSALNAPAGSTHLFAQVKEDKINLRSEPDAHTGGIIGKVRMGEYLRIADYGVDWCCVVKTDGTRGYLMTKFLVFD